MNERRTIMSLVLGCLGLTLALVVGCSGGPDDVSDEEIETAQAAVGSFKKALQTALREGLREGPENAIDVCRIEAPEIAHGLSKEGVTVGRTSHRLRNTANAPAPWMEPLLAAYAGGGDERPWRAVRLDDGSVGYVEPIYVQPVCLKCHGADLAAPVAEKIAATYPHDEAVGFDSGEFRGLFWVMLGAQSSDG